MSGSYNPALFLIPEKALRKLKYRSAEYGGRNAHTLQNILWTESRVQLQNHREDAGYKQLHFLEGGDITIRTKKFGRWRLARVFCDRSRRPDGGKHTGHTNWEGGHCRHPLTSTAKQFVTALCIYINKFFISNSDALPYHFPLTFSLCCIKLSLAFQCAHEQTNQLLAPNGKREAFH